MAKGEHKAGDKLIGSYYGLTQRALVTMIKDRTGKTLKDMMDSMIKSEGIAAGLLDKNGMILPKYKFALEGNVALLRDKDNQRKGTRTKKGNNK